MHTVARARRSTVNPLPASARAPVAPAVALIGLRAQARAPMAETLRRAIPSCDIAVCDALEGLPGDGSHSSPALAVVDADTLGPGLVATLESAQRRFPACRLVVVATASDEADIHRALRAGATTYLPKRYTAGQRELVLRLAWEGVGHLPRYVPATAERCAERSGDQDGASLPSREAPARPDSLTPKQAEVLSYLAEGMPNREIGRLLRIKEGTVKLHMTKILRKLEVDSRGQAILLARRLEQVQRHMLDHGQNGSLVLDGMMSHASHRHYRSGDVIFRKGDPGGELFYVQRGTVHLDEIGEEMRPGDIFGEIGVFSPERARTSTARCNTDVDLFCLDAERAKRVYFESPHFALRIATLLAQRLVAARSHG
jgi:DNA-binding NarL/FixJ family response regulator